MWFVFSMFSVLAWAGADLLTKRGTRPADSLSHLRIVVFTGIVMGICAVVEMISALFMNGLPYLPVNIILYLPVSFMYILSMALGYAGLRYIELSVSSPICNSSGAAAAVLCFFILGQTLEPVQIGAVFLICFGIFLLSLFQKQREDRLRRDRDEPADKKYVSSFLAILFPILYCVIDGLGSFMDALWLENPSFWDFGSVDTALMDETALENMQTAVANVSYQFTFLIVALGALFYILVIKKEPFIYRGERSRARDFGLSAICEAGGQFTYIRALSLNAIAAAPLISSYAMFSVLLSRLFLKEKLERKQYLAIAIVMAGIIVMGFFEE